ncbi:MAG: type III pantothenate kinase [Marinomonas sp.]|nr:type III pantothenate kinase [Marinomonas sp.]|tara:strand:- start:348 stop:1103 length:756 start_codon:yes stop_codon:yes gene_type:complete
MEEKLVSASNRVLVIDAGNTQVKCTLFHANTIVDKWLFDDQLSNRGQEAEFIVIASVRSNEFTSSLLEKCASYMPNAELMLLRSERSSCGVQNSYEEPERLGVDRWLAAIAAFHHYGGPSVVLDAGTAIKAEFLNAEGVHLGGYIVPGLELMASSLIDKTAKIRYHSGEASVCDTIPASTADAVTQGATEMALGFIQRLYGKHSDATWLVTGGTSQALMAALSVPHVYDESLVAKGAYLVWQERLEKRGLK